MTQTMRDGSNLTRTLNNSRFVENKHGETSPCRTFKSYNEHAVQIFGVFFLKGSIYGQRIKASVCSPTQTSHGRPRFKGRGNETVIKKRRTQMIPYS